MGGSVTPSSSAAGALCDTSCFGASGRKSRRGTAATAASRRSSFQFAVASVIAVVVAVSSRPDPVRTLRPRRRDEWSRHSGLWRGGPPARSKADAPGGSAPASTHLLATLIFFGCASGRFGTTTLRTPFFSSARTLSASMP
jgi:hypothetical protein